MKNLIVTVGTVIFAVCICTWQVNINRTSLQKQTLDFVANESLNCIFAMLDQGENDSTEIKTKVKKLAEQNMQRFNDRVYIELFMEKEDSYKNVRIILRQGRLKSKQERKYKMGEKNNDV